MKIISNSAGYCPFCGESNLEYGAIRPEGDMGYFPWKCLTCEHEGEEWYSLKFTGHNVIDENGDNVELNNGNIKESSIEDNSKGKEIKDINLSGFSAEDLSLLEDFCEVILWQPVKTSDGFNIIDLTDGSLVERKDFETFTELVDRIVCFAIDYNRDNIDTSNDYIYVDEVLDYIGRLYNIAKKYTKDTDYLEGVESWLDDLKRESNYDGQRDIS